MGLFDQKWGAHDELQQQIAAARAAKDKAHRDQHEALQQKYFAQKALAAQQAMDAERKHTRNQQRHELAVEALKAFLIGLGPASVGTAALDPETVAKHAYNIAEAMLAERDRRG